MDRKVEPKQPPQIASHHTNHKNHNTLSKIKNKQKQLELIAKIGFEQYTRYFSEHPTHKKVDKDSGNLI
jgi:hypothetical protein